MVVGERGIGGNLLLVQDVEFFGRGVLFQELAGVFSFGGQDDAVVC